MPSLTKHTLRKLELLLEESGYIIRYEKGNFQSGYCVVRDQKVIVVSKFFATEGRVQTLVEILKTLDIQPEILSEKSRKFFRQLQKEEEELQP